jgi:hypothetical protein
VCANVNGNLQVNVDGLPSGGPHNEVPPTCEGCFTSNINQNQIDSVLQTLK